MDTFVEYRVRPVTRYIVTRFEQQRSEHVGNAGHEKTIGSIGSVGNGEFSNSDTAYAVAYALARADHERLGYPLGDPRIRYPEHPSLPNGEYTAQASTGGDLQSALDAQYSQAYAEERARQVASLGLAGAERQSSPER